MPLINCKINLILTWSAEYFKMDISIVGQESTFTTSFTSINKGL